MEQPTTGTDRRAIPQRTQGWAVRVADLLVKLRLTPNTISLISVGFGALAAVALLGVGATEGATRVALLLLAALCIPLRLLCNMLDGMLAVERGMKSVTGEIFNELPDRIADLVVIAAAGYATAGVWAYGGVDFGVALGWLAAALAILTAYVRTLGASMGVGNFFGGPMAKPPRMWVLVAACLVSLFVPSGWAMAVALAVIALGSALTVAVRLRHITTALRERAA